MRCSAALSLLTWLLLAGCGASPIEACAEQDIDCCTRDEECAEYYGSTFPYCVNPGKNSGICAECLSGDDCDVYEVCRDDPVIGGFCIDREAP